MIRVPGTRYSGTDMYLRTQQEQEYFQQQRRALLKFHHFLAARALPSQHVQSTCKHDLINKKARNKGTPTRQRENQRQTAQHAARRHEQHICHYPITTHTYDRLYGLSPAAFCDEGYAVQQWWLTLLEERSRQHGFNWKPTNVFVCCSSVSSSSGTVTLCCAVISP